MKIVRPQGRAPGSVVQAAVGQPLIADDFIERSVIRAEVKRLYDNAIPAAAGAVVVALVFWLMFYRHTHDPRVLIWAVLAHGCQAARLAVLVSFQRAKGTRRDPAVWLFRYRAALFCMSATWGLAPLMFLPAGDLAYTAIMLLVLLGVAVSGITAIATDRLSVMLWIVPLMGPAPIALLWHYSPENLALAAFAVLFIFVNLTYVLKQNHVLSSTLRAQFENAALVKRLNEQVELTAAASKDKSRFLAAASHDLRQPLHALSFFGSTLEKRMANSPDLPLIFNMMRSIEALDRSFNAILDVSKLDAQAVEPHLQLFPLRDLFRRLQMSFGGQAEEAGLQLRFKPGGKIVKSDPQLLERTLANLVQNGLRYCRGGGVVVLARNWRGGTNIEVWDTGIGIPETELPKIFGEFYQVANPERDRNKGLGIGLAIVSRLTLLLDHTLTVQSRVGQGSLFRIWIKGSDLEQMDEFTVGSDTVPTRIDDIRTILFIDDEEAIRTSVSDLLRQWGYTVLATATVDEARRAALNHDSVIDVVISDLRLRGGEDGILAIEQIRQVCGYTVPAVLVTGDTAPDQVQRIHESGHIVLFKPVRPKDLYDVLKRIV
ncbi:MAG: hybrid sensor histidine kinase/response regulator [Burkholderiales bacterium]|nr:hybrid sensor histidine kinase/response regulator [Burkholderiales bacterium]